jgi:hypothetical protein
MVSIKMKYLTEAGAHSCATLDEYIEFLKEQVINIAAKVQEVKP